MRPSCPLLRSPFYFLLSSGIIRLMPFTFEKLIVYQKAVTFARGGRGFLLSLKELRYFGRR
jgi:hypothetical protein